MGEGTVGKNAQPERQGKKPGRGLSATAFLYYHTQYGWCSTVQAFSGGMACSWCQTVDSSLNSPPSSRRKLRTGKLCLVCTVRALYITRCAKETIASRDTAAPPRPRPAFSHFDDLLDRFFLFLLLLQLN